MQVRRGTGRVNATDVRDQQASAGHRDTLPEAGRDMLQMYPAEAQKRAQLGGAALLAHRGAEWPLPARNNTPPATAVGGMFLTLTTSCAVTWAGRTASPVR